MGKAFLWAVKLLVREIRDCKQVVKDAIDTYRHTHGLPLLYMKEQEPAPEPSADSFINNGDYLTGWMLEELALEQIGRIPPDMDLEKEARARGWVDEDGKFLLVPQSLAGMRMVDSEVVPLLSERLLNKV